MKKLNSASQLNVTAFPAESTAEQPPADATAIVDQVLSAFGLKAGGRDIEQAGLGSHQPLQFDIAPREFGPSASGRWAETPSLTVSVGTCWPPESGNVQTGGCFVTLGKSPHPRFTTAVSSRLGRTLEEHRHWFEALRTYCLLIEPDACLLMNPGQYTFRFLRRMSEWVQLRRALVLQATVADLRKAMAQAIEFNSPTTDASLLGVIRVVDQASQFRGADQCVAELCDEVRVLHVRPGGNIANLITHRLAAKSAPRRRTLILTKHAESVQRFLAAGAIPWHVYDPQAGLSAAMQPPEPIPLPLGRKILRLSEIDATKYIAHYTRRQSGGWVDERESNYLDALIFGGSDADRGPLATLWRIVQQRQLVASNRLTRDATRVVCFTNRPLSEFTTLRKFRSHLARWDFEPYGIAISRERLLELGGRPVTYGDETMWTALTAAEKPFFQVFGGAGSDWPSEQEWRMIGDVDLNQFAADQAIVFVASESDARQLAQISPWPIVLLMD